MGTYGYETPSVIVDNAGQVLNVSTVLGVLWRNVDVIQGRSYRLMSAFDTAGEYETAAAPGAYPATGNVLLGRWFVPYSSGMTNLHVEGYANGYSTTERIKVFVNGVDLTGGGIVAGATWSQDFSISSGYADGQIITIEVYVTGTRPTNAWYLVGGIWAEPITYAPVYVAPDTFTTQIGRSDRIIKLANAIDWLWNRIGIVPRTAVRNQRYINGPFADPATPGHANHSAYPLAYRTIQRNYTEDILRIYGQLVNQTSTALRYVVYVNGVLAYTSPDYSPGTYTISLALDLSPYVAVGARARVSILGVVTNAGPNAPWKQSKWTFTTIRTEPVASGYPYASLPAYWTEAAAGTLPPAETVRDRLNALKTIVDGIKSRVDSQPSIYSRVYAMRDWYGDGREVFQKRGRLVSYHRGSRLVVTGQSVDMRWGPVVFDPDPNSTDKYTNYQITQSQNIIGDTAQTATIYLDADERFRGLNPSVLYELWSANRIFWAAEYY